MTHFDLQEANVYFRERFPLLTEEQKNHFWDRKLHTSRFCYKQALSLLLKKDYQSAYYYASSGNYDAISHQETVDKCQTLLASAREGLIEQYAKHQETIFRNTATSGKFAFKKNKFGYIDESQGIFIDFQYDHIELNKIHQGKPAYFRAEKNKQKYLVFLSGEEYPMAENIQDLNAETEAFVLYDNPVFTDFDKIAAYPKIKILIMDFSGLSEIPQSIGKMSNLERLSLRQNDIRSFPESFFHLKKLKHLDLSENLSLITIPEEISQLKELESLYLDDCYLGESEWDKERRERRKPESTAKIIGLPNTLKELKKLSTLSIKGNSLGEIPMMIADIPNLKELSLKSNNIDDTTLPVLYNLTKLEKLNLSQNKITQFPRKHTKLRHLNLSSNKLSEVTEDIKTLTSLETLDISYNQIASISIDLSSLKYLKLIDLSSNALMAAPTKTGNVKFVTENNKFNKEERYSTYTEPPSIQELLKKSETTSKLNLFNENLEQFPFSIMEVSHLDSLDISNNKLAPFFIEICKLKKLKHLNIKSNNLSSIPKEINALENLESLSLGKNNLTPDSLPAEFSKLNKLSELDLSFNHFDTIPKPVLELKALNELALLQNPIQSFPEELLNMPCLNRLILDFDLDWTAWESIFKELAKSCDIIMTDKFGNFKNIAEYV